MRALYSSQSHVGRRPPSRLVLLLGTLLFASPLYYLLGLIAPAVISDWAIRDTARPSTHHQIEDVSCHNVNLVFTYCSVIFLYRQDGELRARPVVYAYFAPYTRSVAYRIVADPLHVESVTTDVGLDHLVNRTICLVLGTVLFGGFTLAGVAGLCGLLPRRS